MLDVYFGSLVHFVFEKYKLFTIFLSYLDCSVLYLNLSVLFIYNGSLPCLFQSKGRSISSD